MTDMKQQVRKTLDSVTMPPLIGPLADLPDHVKQVVEAYGRACAREAIVAALRAAPEWQPMDSAPRDGTVVLVAIDGSDIPQPCRFRERVGWVIAWDEWRIPAHDGPLGWIPLPLAARPQGVKGV